MPLYMLPAPATVQVLSTVTSSASATSSSSDSASDIEESRRELEAIHILLDERLPIPEESQSELEE